MQEAVLRSIAAQRVLEGQYLPTNPGRINSTRPSSRRSPTSSAHIDSAHRGHADLKGKLSTTDPRKSGLSSTSKPATSSMSMAKSSEKKITDLSGYLQKLESELLPTDIDEFNITSPARDQNSVHGAEEDETITEPSHQPLRPTSLTGADRIVYGSLNEYVPRLPAVLPTSVPLPSIVQDDPQSLLESSFPPDYDRGRYPLLRRRRENKYYTPAPHSLEEVPYNSNPSVSASQSSQIATTWTHEASKRSQAPSATNATSSSEMSQGVLSQMFIARVATDPFAEALLKVIASGTASLAQLAEFQALTKELKGAKQSQEIGDSAGSTSHYTNVASSEAQSDTTMNSGASASASYFQGTVNHPRIQATSQEDIKRTVKRLRSIVDVQPQTIKQPSISRLSTTAYDPHLEQLVAVLITNETKDHNPSNRANRHSIYHFEQEELLHNKAVLRSADVARPHWETELHKTDKPNFTRLETKVVDPVRRPERYIPSLLRHRELGSDSNGRCVNIQRELCLRRSEMIEPWRYWKGASGDIVAAAWSPDSITYAVGAAAHTNPEDVQYNRSCNLLLGDLHLNTLTELPDHRVDRPKPGTLADTYNARQAVYEACDPMVYETVSSIAFSPRADRMYTASHDRTVKIWDTSAPHHSPMTLQHDAHVTSVEVSAHTPGLFATGSNVIENAVRVYYMENNYALHVDFSSSRAVAKPALNIHPECLRWGPSAWTSHLLLAGFHQNHTDEPSQEGQLCLWDANAFQFIKVIPSSQSVFAAAWHPTMNYFATGGAPGGNILTDKFRTKTVVRTWDVRAPGHYTMEYECSALDMQDITFHPINSNIVTAGCTDGTTFVWDYRRPDYPLHRLRHGKPLVDWDHTRGSREVVDTGVMMSLWGPGATLFYTGSSDGMIKAWDIRRHPQDVLIRNVAQFGAGIQSGAFSPDGTNLLVGDADGGIHVLSSAPCGPQPVDSGCDDLSPELPITLVRAPDGSGLALDVNDNDPGTEGREAAKDLIDSGQVIFDLNFGVTQGLSYKTPYAENVEKEDVDPDAVRLCTVESAEGNQSLIRMRKSTEEEKDVRRAIIKARRQRIVELYPQSKTARAEGIRSGQNASGDGLRNHPTSGHPESDRSGLTTRENVLDRDGDYPMFNSLPSNQRRTSAGDSFPASFKRKSTYCHSLAFFGKVKPPVLGMPTDDVEDNIISESEMVEQNDWWPRLNEDEIQRARAGKGHENHAD